MATFEKSPDLSPSAAHGSELTLTSNVHQRVPHDPANTTKTSSEYFKARDLLQNEKREEKPGLSSSRKLSGKALNTIIQDNEAFRVVFVLDMTKIVILIFGILAIVALALLYTPKDITSLVVHGSSLCSLPLITTMVPTCHTIYSPRQDIQTPKYTDLVNLQTRFVSIMQNAGIGLSLSSDMKMSEMAVRDLNTLVKLSDLPSKDQLSSSLDGYVSVVKDAIRHLRRLDAGVGGAVDSIISMDGWVVETLEAIVQQEKSKDVSNSVLLSFDSSVVTRAKLMETFNQTVSLTELNLRRLIDQAMAAASVLDNLEKQLTVIDEIVKRGEGTNKRETEETLAYLWTRFGGNQAELANFASHHSLLSQAAEYRKIASQQVGGTLSQLEQLAADLDELRQRVAMTLLMKKEFVPIEVHLSVLRGGVEQLVEGRAIAKEKEDAVRKRLSEGPQYPELSFR
ncbi:hypothetical protein FS842_007347 [Serendipita sp. 407]|nr:hypothetical protein FS842_007347 [Serendipita sp. 407]